MSINLYRGKRKDNGEWIEGFCVQVNNKVYISLPLDVSGDGVVTMFDEKQTKANLYTLAPFLEVIPETVGQSRTVGGGEMSLLIKGMDMPECCEECPCYNWVEDICRITESPNDFSDTRIEDCPLVEVPTPHGRLIDADRLTKAIENAMNREDDPLGYDAAEIVEEIYGTETIVEAEE